MYNYGPYLKLVQMIICSDVYIEWKNIVTLQTPIIVFFVLK